MSDHSSIQMIDISSCKLRPYFPNWILKLKNLARLNIANNRISYTFSIQFWNMWFSQSIDIDLSSNNFSGSIPNVSSGLERLDLSHNKFYGQISFLCQITDGSLYFLDLSNNSFIGAIPDCLWHFNELKVLNLGRNNLSGRLPISIGYLIGLEVLQLDNNNFTGELPLSLQNCTQLTFLELGVNKFTGYVPIWIGESAREFRNNIGMLKSIDLSNNFLTEQIPYELTNLLELMQLNLSNNALSGAIPDKIGEMKELEILDLSRNKLSGRIPSSISRITFLNYLDVSYNDLSGRIPVSTQLQSFEALRYIGNVGLYGLPLPKYCPGDKELKAPIISQNEGGGEGIDELDRLFLIGGASGFATGFWIVCCGLHVNWHGRNEFFRFLDNLKDWVYIKVTMFIARRQRASYV
ncbi:hypothetical protein QVD17_01037 [Tagetes erecta]|uniref:Uncharacterized protein n=1 Tax=Tagetes erecta TaxID=13708 RepID=A0AAD8L9W3_TARER|nr:hypothetical protein QVD17_01037 [Tagetes erecta]